MGELEKMKGEIQDKLERGGRDVDVDYWSKVLGTSTHPPTHPPTRPPAHPPTYSVCGCRGERGGSNALLWVVGGWVNDSQRADESMDLTGLEAKNVSPTHSLPPPPKTNRRAPSLPGQSLPPRTAPSHASHPTPPPRREETRTRPPQTRERTGQAAPTRARRRRLPLFLLFRRRRKEDGPRPRTRKHRYVQPTHPPTHPPTQCEQEGEDYLSSSSSSSSEGEGRKTAPAPEPKNTSTYNPPVPTHPLFNHPPTHPPTHLPQTGYDDSAAALALLSAERNKGLGEDEATLGKKDEVLLDGMLESGEGGEGVLGEGGGKTYWWQDRYRPRKPRYFNRVKTGKERRRKASPTHPPIHPSSPNPQ